MSGERPFSFSQAFDRNIGWLTEWEQLALRSKRIAIAGMGGVGGFHLLTLARLGIGAFNIADLDHFELANFNRQIGATMNTLGRPKAEVLGEMALAINPEIKLKRFDAGVSDANIDEFLSGVDLFVDGFDFFVLDIRRKVFARCAELGIPAVTAAPVGMGVGFLAFTRHGMSFEDYFRFEGRSELRQYIHFLLGVAPRGLHRAYLVDPSRLDLANHRAPSTVAGCQLCASVTAVAAVKLLLGRGVVEPAPSHLHFDAYLGKLAMTRLRWGNAGPLQRIKATVAERTFRPMYERPASPPEIKRVLSPIEEILSVARWCPSGDNTQPWRFEVTGDDTVIVRLKDGCDHDPYDYRNGEPTLLSGGMLLESLRIAATAHGRSMDWHYDGMEGPRHRITVRFPRRAESEIDALYGCLPLRSVNRRPYRSRSLTERDKQALSSAAGNGVNVQWHEGFRRRWRFAGLSARATNIRLRIIETFRIHQKVLDFKRTQSPTGIPATAIGLDRMTLKVMGWAMRTWPRTKFLNRLGGPLTAMLQMDYLPGLSSAGYFTIRLPTIASTSEDRVTLLLQAGAAIQRFWLTATKLGLAIQPSLATLIFADYGKTSKPFTSDAAAAANAASLAVALEQALNGTLDSLVFMGRIGWPRPQLQISRSIRRPIEELLESPAHVPSEKSSYVEAA